jgi:nitrate/nitrite-specific signal transduction histidine kinase
MTQDQASKTPSGGGKFHRKHYFIDRKFQGRYMMTFFIPMVVMLAFMLCTLYFATQTIIDTTTRMLKKDVENAVSQQLQDRENPSIEQYRIAIADAESRIKTFSQSKELKHEVLSTLLIVFGIGLLLVIVQIVFMTIFFSHKIAGPIYRFECLCHEMIEGRYTSQIHLRRGDNLTNLAGLFNSAVASTRQRLSDLANEPDAAKRRDIASKLEL